MSCSKHVFVVEMSPVVKVGALMNFMSKPRTEQASGAMVLPSARSWKAS